MIRNAPRLLVDFNAKAERAQQYLDNAELELAALDESNTNFPKVLVETKQ